MKKTIISLVLCFFLSTYPGTGSEPIGQLISDFLSTDWPTVLVAKEKIENIGSACISDMIAIMNDCRELKLQNTGDLIYPGAEKFFGHGQIIDYDIDIACVRAGWLLEDLTFRNFGFTGIHLPDNELTGFIQNNFPDYFNNPANHTQYEELTASGKRRLIRSLSIEQVNNWWKTVAASWNRLDALENALNSKDEKCQVKALFYMRYGITKCKGLNERYYRTRLDNSIKKLSRVDLGRVSEHAKLIMLDSDFDWLAIKPVD